jgi:II/X family phage/plasmid replication protein
MGDSYQTTCYFGSKNSRIKKLKIYSKYEEMTYDLKKVEKNKFIDSATIIKELLNTDFCKQAIRFEATVKKRFLERKGIPTLAIDLIKYIDNNPNFYQYIFNDAWKDIFETFKGQEIEIMNDEAVLNGIQKVHTSYTKSGKESLVKVNRLFHVYKLIETMGYDYAKNMSKKSMFYNNISDLKKCGFSKSTLQNLHKKNNEKIIPLKWYVNIDFSIQFPDKYKECKNLWEM